MQLQSGAAASGYRHSMQDPYLEQVEHLGWQALKGKQTNQYETVLIGH